MQKTYQESSAHGVGIYMAEDVHITPGQGTESKARTKE